MGRMRMGSLLMKTPTLSLRILIPYARWSTKFGQILTPRCLLCSETPWFLYLVKWRRLFKFFHMLNMIFWMPVFLGGTQVCDEPACWSCSSCFDCHSLKRFDYGVRLLMCVLFFVISDLVTRFLMGLKVRWFRCFDRLPTGFLGAVLLLVVAFIVLPLFMQLSQPLMVHVHSFLHFMFYKMYKLFQYRGVFRVRYRVKRLIIGLMLFVEDGSWICLSLFVVLLVKVLVRSVLCLGESYSSCL